MYNLIKPHYDNDDIWQRKEEYYNQVIDTNRKRLSPHKPIKLQQIPQPGTFINNLSHVSQIHSSITHNRQSIPISNITPQTNIQISKISQINPKPPQQKPIHSTVSQSLRQTDPQRYKVLQQRAELYKRLQLVTLGLPIKQNTQQTQLLSTNYIMPHYKSQNLSQVKEQERQIKKLTVQMLQNEKVISKISRTKEMLVDRVQRIRKIDKQIYTKLDEDKNKQIQNYLRIAKNLLAEGQAEEKIANVLKKILY